MTAMTSNTQPNFESYLALADRIGGDVRLAPLNEASQPDFTAANLLNLAYAPADTVQPEEASRLCVTADSFHLHAKDVQASTTMLVHYGADGTLEQSQIYGPIEDYAVVSGLVRRRVDGLPWRERLIAANDNQPKPAPKPKARFDLTWFDDIEETATREQLVKGVFTAGEFSYIVGLPGAGKSVITTDIACHVAAGREWQGRRVRPGLVVYIAAERKKLTERRMNAFKRRHGVSDVPLVVVGGRVDLTRNLDDARALVATIKQAEDKTGLQCVWVIIDTLTRTFGGGDQNTSQDMTKFIGSCDEILTATGAHVTVIHHTAWTGERAKGAIDLDGAVDASFMVKKTRGVYSLVCDGTNDGETGLVTNFKLEGVQVGTDDDGEPITAPVVVQCDSEPADGLMAGLKGHAGKVLDALRTALLVSGIEPEGDHFPDDVLVVTEDQWRQAYYDSDPLALPDTRKKRFGRARESLVADGAVIQTGQWFFPQVE